MTVLDRGGIANSHHCTRGIIQNVFHIPNICLCIGLVLEGDQGIEYGFLAGLDLARSIQGGLRQPWLGKLRPAIGFIREVLVLLQDQGFLREEDLVQIVGTRPDPEMTVILDTTS